MDADALEGIYKKVHAAIRANPDRKAKSEKPHDAKYKNPARRNAAAAAERQRRAEAGQEDEDFGGINIDKAKSVLKAEDKFDKLLERQRIKARKLEEKRKAKEAKKRKKDQDEVKNYSLSGALGLI